LPKVVRQKHVLNRSEMMNAVLPVLCRYADARKRGQRVCMLWFERRRWWSVSQTVDHHDSVVVRIAEARSVHNVPGIRWDPDKV
jgi:hypothetical protein